MDPLEEKIRKQFASIKTGNKELLETDIIHSIEVKEKLLTFNCFFLTSNSILNNKKIYKKNQFRFTQTRRNRRYPL